MIGCPGRRRAIVTSAWVAFSVALAGLTTVEAQQSLLAYQKRGDRSEGLKPRPVSGYSLELLSAQAEPLQSASSGWPKELKLRFFLPGNPAVHITVRQLRSRSTYYWLDRVQQAWASNSVNEYSWSTETVLSKTEALESNGLGVVVRLREEVPGNLEEVAPASLSGSGPSTNVEGYRFTFKTNGRARVTARLYRDRESKPLYERPANVEETDSPFTVRFPTQAYPEGFYRLVLDSQFSSGPQSKEVRFYHTPSLR